MPSEIRVRLGDLVEQEAALLRVASSVRLRGQLLYDVVRLQRAVAAETSVFRAERDRLIQEMGIDRDATRTERDSFGVTTVREVSPAAMPAFRAALAELGAVEVCLPCAPLPLRDLAAHDLVPADLQAMGALLDLTEGLETPLP